MGKIFAAQITISSVFRLLKKLNNCQKVLIHLNFRFVTDCTLKKFPICGEKKYSDFHENFACSLFYSIYWFNIWLPIVASCFAWTAVDTSTNWFSFSRSILVVWTLWTGKMLDDWRTSFLNFATGILTEIHF